MMFKDVVLVGALALVTGALGADAAARTPAAQGARGGSASSSNAEVLGTVTLDKGVKADGKALAAGTYQVRLSNDEVKPAVGQAAGAERWVEFVRGGQVVGREVATVVNAQDIGQIAKGRQPKPNSSMVELLKGGDYWRVWINKGGTNYIINLPPA
jgi:hypothetical protein